MENFLQHTAPERHECDARAEDDGMVIVYTCPLCPGWERRFDLRAHTMQTTNKDLYFDISHAGQWSALPTEVMSVTMQGDITQPTSTGEKLTRRHFNPN